MKKMLEQIVFFGSGPVAAKSLELLAQDFTIEAVVTKPRPDHHKGDVPVLRVAATLGLPTYTVTDKKSLDMLCDTKPFSSRIGILIDFGIIVSQKVIDSFPLGIVNSHFSILPEWRGADPITFSILSGQKQTGVSLMLLTAGMDEGPILAYGIHDLTPTVTTPELTDDLIDLSFTLLHEIVPRYVSGEIVPHEQDENKKVSYSRKLTKNDGEIDWSKPAEQIEREIRAFIEWPKSRTTLNTLDIIITKAHTIELTGLPGSFTIYDKQLVATCGTKALAIDRLKPAGKKEMSGQEFLAGYKHLIE